MPRRSGRPANPVGWYIAQGLPPHPRAPRTEGPCELPSGHLVCGPHGLEVCGLCCSDYTFMDDVLSGEEDDDDEDEFDGRSYGISGVSIDVTHRDIGPAQPQQLSPKLRRWNGRIFPTVFVPPSTTITPDALFTRHGGYSSVRDFLRYTLPHDPGTGIIRTDGACSNNGQSDPKAAWAFWHGVDPQGNKLICAGGLEGQGPFGDPGIQSSNRAELRAVIAALRYRYWPHPGEGFHTLVIATDSEYVVNGATQWARSWINRDWMGRNGPVKNKDLWEALLGEIEKRSEQGMATKFWRIPREWNTVADETAKDAITNGWRCNGWVDISGTAWGDARVQN